MQFVELSDARIGFTVEGDEAGPPLLLLMGLGGSAAEWGEEFLDALRPHLRLIRPDNRGIGHSENRASEFDMETMARDGLAVLDAVGLSQANVLGFSMGGMIAQQMALLAPDRIASLVLLSTHFGGSEVVPLQPRARVLFEKQPPGQSRQQYFERLFVQLTAEGFGERHVHEAQGFIAARVRNPVSLDIYKHQLNSILSSDRSQSVTTLPQRTLVLHGQEDPLIPVENGRNLAARIPQATLTELPECGHLPTWEQPQEVAEHMLRFLRG